MSRGGVSAALRVVVADDSVFMRRLLSDALAGHGFEVVASAGDGDGAIAACVNHRPDVLTLDLTMPGLDGIGVLRRLRETGLPVSVVVVSAFSPAHGAHAVDALAEGAVELVAKPQQREGLDAFISELCGKVELASVSRRGVGAPGRPADVGSVGAVRTVGTRAVLIACSTGGPRALVELVPRLPSPLGAGAVIVQHMPAGFTGSLAARLDSASRLSVREAAGGERIEADTALLAPGGWHLHVRRDRSTALGSDAPVGGLRPRADITIAELARAFGGDVLLVILTGMGRDGLQGAREVRRLGGRILAEAEASCTVYGMPRAVVEAGLADGVHELGRLPKAIAQELAA